ncbi:ICP22 family protein [Mycolicibacterium palauense]|uniref:hypothetical protein n=1 Tax=Mycolicibacterium palauense TaxID=2034511 RepID=UPI000BFED74D|nr:hypothetical protein [Mycolicibacterium palauense]
MAGFDVAARLADGTPALERLQTYVWACALRGYVHPDLTGHAGQVRDWYGRQDGLDLSILDADASALRAAAARAEDGVSTARSAAESLAAAWSGSAAGVAADFVRRHCVAAARCTEALHRAAEAFAGLRDELWQAVDRQVTVTVGVDEQASAHHGRWLAAARSVLAGGADDDGVVASEVLPYVDNVVGGQWVPGMRVVFDRVVSAYRSAVLAVDAAVPGRFEIPGELAPPPRAAFAAAGSVSGPGPGPMGSPFAAPTAGALGPDPGGMSAPAPAIPGDGGAGPATAAAPGAVPGQEAAGSPPALDSVAALPGRLADAVGGLLGAPADGLGGLSGLDPLRPAGLDVPDLGPPADPFGPDETAGPGEGPADPVDETGEDTEEDTAEEDTEENAGGTEDEESAEEGTEGGDAGESEEADDPEAADGDPGDPGATVDTEEPADPAEPATAPGGPADGAAHPGDGVIAPVPEPSIPPPAGATPCEIAADELPQAGE